MFDLTHKKALITGGGSGIGRAICQVFASRGAQVYVLDVNDTEGEETVRSISEKGGKAAYFPCDVINAEMVKSVFAAIGGVDILVNNAGIAHVGNVENTNFPEFHKVMAVNVKGVFHCMQAAVPYMKAGGGGVILNMASIAALVGLPDRFVYSTSKGAVIGMTLSVARDYLSYGIRCNSISPARVHTPFVDGFIEKNYPGQEAEMFEKLSKTQPIGRMATPAEVAALALYLCSDEASFITGCDYPIDGGFVKLNN